MKIDLRKPRYVIPLILLPFLCIFFYVYKSSFGKETPQLAGEESLQTDLASVSDRVRDQTLADKLDAYRNQYRQADGYTAIGTIQEEQASTEAPVTLYNERERQKLDSINRVMKARYGASNSNVAFPVAESQVRGRSVDDTHDNEIMRLNFPFLPSSLSSSLASCPSEQCLTFSTFLKLPCSHAPTRESTKII